MNTQMIQWGFDALFTIVGLLGGWILNTMWDELKEARKAHNDLADKLPETYARRDEMARTIDKLEKTITDGLARIFDKLDGKADK